MTKCCAAPELGKRLRTITSFSTNERSARWIGRRLQEIISLHARLRNSPTGEGVGLRRIGTDSRPNCARGIPQRLRLVAAVSLNDVEGSVADGGAGLTQLGAGGIQVFTPLAGRPLARRFARCSRHGGL